MDLMQTLEETIELCNNNTDSVRALLYVYKKICEECKIDKLSIVVYNFELDKYITTSTYTPEFGFEFSLEQKNWDMEKYLNLKNPHYNKEQQAFKDLCGDKSHICTDDYTSIKSVMDGIGFVCSNQENLSQIYISATETEERYFTYCVFEKYGTEKMTDEQVRFINILRGLTTNRSKSMLEIYRYHKEISSRDTINTMLSQKFAMIIVNSQTNEVIRFTELFLKEIPDIKVGMIIDEDELEAQTEKILEKTMPFRLADNHEAHIIYLEDNKIKKDILTNTILYESFEENFEDFVKPSSIDYALCSLDIDKFKYINSMFGYNIGDDVLKRVSEVIQNFITINEFFCRIGEDKFCVILAYSNELELHSKLTKLSRLFEKMRDTYFSEIKITVVMGVTLVDKQLSLSTLLDQSTTARKSVKGSHKNKFSYYNIEWDLKLKKEMEIEEQIPHAISNDEFNVFLQPKFNLNTKKICGAEALVRWITPKGMIFPDQFIPLFEKNGFIITLDFIIYEKVMIYIRKCLDENLPVYPISVNVSRNHVKDKHFINKFIALINKYSIPKEYLELEVTESTFIEDRADLKHFIDTIKEQNLKVSIDDFGTAYSSLQTLTDINIDVLKIDKGFLNNIGNAEDINSSKDRILMKNIINLANELDFTGICEGVETNEQIEFLKEIGCNLGQGYVFAKPMSTTDYHNEYIINNN
ncbi:MAG: bifunctional diguanylate cyclase/phosphodiesterase [bacterium]